MAHVCRGQLKRYAVRFIHPSKHQAITGVCIPQQVATLTSISDAQSKTQKPKPWPYEKRPYNFLYQFMDHTTKRFDDNSKVIVIDGNIATGKSELGEKIAQEFDMKYFPDVTDDDIFLVGNGFDTRELNEQLPLTARYCDMKTFYLQNAPKVQLARYANSQFKMYVNRYFRYLKALEHLLNTGQGVVVERSVWGDISFVEAMRRVQHLSLESYKYLKMARTNTICQLWKPHLTIYLDAPVETVRERIKRRNVDFEVNSPVLTDQFISEIGRYQKENHLNEMRKYGEVLEYSVLEMPDFEMIVEDLERLNLDDVGDPDSDVFSNWHHKLEDDWNAYRLDVSNKSAHMTFFNLPIPWKATEMYWSGDDAQALESIVSTHPDVQYDPKYDPRKISHLLQW